MRVLYVNQSSAPNPLLPPLVRALHPDRVEFVVVTLDAGGPLLRELDGTGVSVHCLDLGSGSSLVTGVAQLRKLIRAVKPELVHSNLFLPGLQVALASIGLPTPVVYTRHHDDSHHLAGKRLQVAIDRWTAGSAQRVIAPSKAVADTLVEREAVRRDRVTVVHHGLEWDRIRDAGLRDRQRWRSELGPGPLAVAVGRLDDLKDYPTLLRALAIAGQSWPDLRLAIAGPAGSGAADRLAALAQAARLPPDRMHAMGHIPTVHGLVAAADVFVQASRAESFGLSVLEAAGLGVPLAVTTPGGVAEIVAPWYGQLPAGDPRALAARINEILEDPSAARRAADRSALHVRMRFTAERMAAGHLAVYDRVLSSARR